MADTIIAGFGDIGTADGSKPADALTLPPTNGQWNGWGTNNSVESVIDYTVPWTLKLYDASNTQVGETQSFPVAESNGIYGAGTITIPLSEANMKVKVHYIRLTAGGTGYYLHCKLVQEAQLTGNVIFKFNNFRNCAYDDGKGRTGWTQGVFFASYTGAENTLTYTAVTPSGGGSDALFVMLDGQLQGVTPVVKG